MKYTPIRALLVRNFRNLQEVVVDFTKSPIVSLVGDNEAGKSSVIKALETIGANLDPNTQKEYIRTGCSGFLIAIKFDDEDGTMVIREKSPGFNGYRVQKGNTQVWGVTKMDGSEVPPEIQKYTGFVIEPETKQLLNIRTYEDLMLLIHTQSSVNYKVMYNALKVENLMKAKAAGVKEMNSHRRVISDSEASIETLTGQLRKIKLLDLEPLLNIKARLQSEQEVIGLVEEAQLSKNRIIEIDKTSSLVDTLNKLETLNEMEIYSLNEAEQLKSELDNIAPRLKFIDEINKLESVDEGLYDKLESAIELVSSLHEDKADIYKEVNNLEIIDFDVVYRLCEALGIKEWISSNIKESTLEIEKLSEVSEVGLSLLDTILEGSKELSKLDIDIKDLEDNQSSEIDTSEIEMMLNIMSGMQEIDRYTTGINNIKASINELEDKMKQFGVMVTTCSNCGETVIFSEV